MANPLLGLTVVKKFTYRGDPEEEWSNTYHFTAPPPSNDGNWKYVADRLIANEVLLYPPSSKVVRAYGYDNDDPKAYAVWTYDYEAAGEAVAGSLLVPANSYHVAGDQAAMIECKLEKRNARGKNIYLRKYFHDGYGDNAAHDSLAANYKAALDQWAIALSTGLEASLGRWRARAYDSPAISWGASPYITTRTLHRRGKRPPAPA
jgi:hypothetical protein